MRRRLTIFIHHVCHLQTTPISIPWSAGVLWCSLKVRGSVSVALAKCGNGLVMWPRSKQEQMSFGCRQSYSTFLRCSELRSFSHDVLWFAKRFPYYYFCIIIIIIMTINIKVLVNWDHFLSTHSVLFWGMQLNPCNIECNIILAMVTNLQVFINTSISMTVLSFISLHRICEKKRKHNI